MSGVRRPRAPFSVGADVRTAETLPGWVYGDEALHADLVERLFARSWQPLEPAVEALPAGRASPFTFLPGSVDESLAAARDAAGALHVFSNVCTHRGHAVVGEACASARLRCRYHGRTFGPDGRFVHAPGFEGAIGVPSARDHLAPLTLASWGPLTFAALPGAAPFLEQFGPALARLPGPSLARATFDAARSRDYDVQASWIAYVDNYLEGFHIPFVHGGLNAVLDASAYCIDPVERGVLQQGFERSADGQRASPPETGAAPASALYLWLFPNLMLNVYPWGLSLNVVEPLSPTHTRVRFRSYVADASALNRGAGADLDTVQAEDERVVESVQRGVRSRLYQRGRYAPLHEVGVHAFHRLLAAAVMEADSRPGRDG